MSGGSSTATAATRPLLLAAAVVLVFSLALALPGFPPSSIWMDEAWSASAANLSVIDAIVLTLRFDLHPPLYYAQMSLWGLAGQSDAWLFGNSLFWGVLAAVSLTVIGGRLYGWRIGLAAGLILAALPLFGSTVHSMRMYAFLMALAVWSWGAWHAAFGARRFWPWALLAVFLQWCMAYTQGAGAIMAGFVGLYALGLAWEKKTSLADLRPTLAAQILFGLGCLPALANSAVRSLSTEGHAVAPDIADVVSTISSLVSAVSSGPAAWLAGAVFLAIAAAGLLKRETRWTTFCFLVAPFAAAALVSYAVKPIWLTRLFIFTLPFIALVTAAILISAFPNRRRAAAFAVAALILLGAVQTLNERRHTAPPQDYRALAEITVKRAQPGDVVFAPRFWDYWAVMRYAFGADWGSPLAVQGRTTTERWQSIYDRLGPAWMRRLKLQPETDRIERNGVTYVIGPSIPSAFAAANRIWVIEPLRLDETLPFADTHRILETIDVHGLKLVAYGRDSGSVP